MRPTDAASTAASPRWLAFSALIIVVLLLAACGSAGSAPAAQLGGDELNAVDNSGAGSGEDGGEAERGGADQSDGRLAAISGQRIVKTGEVTIEVDNVANALGRVRAMAVDLGGYVGGSQAGTLDDRATLTLRIPADRFEEALSRLHELGGEVIAEATREDDVTSQIVDLEARIANLQASEASYRLLLDRAAEIDDILAVQSRLDQVRGEIEQLQAQLQNVSGQADLSTLTVTLSPRPQPVEIVAEAWDPGAELSRAVASLVGIGQGLANGLIWFAVVWLPILLVLAVLALFALRGVLELRRRMPVTPAGEPPAG